MDDLLQLCADLPTRSFGAGETIVPAGAPAGDLHVLVEGAVEVRNEAVTITRISRPGAVVGEISALLGTPTTAAVVATEPTTTHVIEGGRAALEQDARLAVAVGRVLARRLAAMTTYLVDLRNQYGAQGGHLALMDRILAELMATAPSATEAPGSERDDQPPY